MLLSFQCMWLCFVCLQLYSWTVIEHVIQTAKVAFGSACEEHKIIYLFGATFIKNDELSKVSSVGKDSHTIKWCWCKHRQWPNPPMFYGPKFAGLIYTQKRKQIKEDWCRGDRRNLLQGSAEILKFAFLLLLHALLCLVLCSKHRSINSKR